MFPIFLPRATYLQIAALHRWDHQHRGSAAFTFEPYMIQRCQKQRSKFRRLPVDALSYIGHLGPFSGHDVFPTDASKNVMRLI